MNLAALLVLLPSMAHADGPHPASLQILSPADGTILSDWSHPLSVHGGFTVPGGNSAVFECRSLLDGVQVFGGRFGAGGPRDTTLDVASLPLGRGAMLPACPPASGPCSSPVSRRTAWSRVACWGAPTPTPRPQCGGRSSWGTGRRARWPPTGTLHAGQARLSRIGSPRTRPTACTRISQWGRAVPARSTRTAPQSVGVPSGRIPHMVPRTTRPDRSMGSRCPRTAARPAPWTNPA